MALTSPRFAGNARLQKAAENSPPLKQGERGEGVAIVQMALIDLGEPMPNSTRQGKALPDGIFGPETAQAVRRFQQNNGLMADAVVGRMTLGRLEEAIVLLMQMLATGDAATARARRAITDDG